MKIGSFVRAADLAEIKGGGPLALSPNGIPIRYTVDVGTLLTLGYDANSIEQDDGLAQRKLGLVFPTIVRRLFDMCAFPRTGSSRKRSRSCGRGSMS